MCVIGATPAHCSECESYIEEVLTERTTERSHYNSTRCLLNGHVWASLFAQRSRIHLRSFRRVFMSTSSPSRSIWKRGSLPACFVSLRPKGALLKACLLSPRAFISHISQLICNLSRTKCVCQQPDLTYHTLEFQPRRSLAYRSRRCLPGCSCVV